ncbi:hypothetical protein [uncultured Helicobacter sp.]|uniref:hypothetical protein n=1 Tax=uncultured Helicobacter sp. TaxID=175537 RepID=UPI002636C6D7|nr:hypothetical protein [uncultured Helicobacter sp.]
MNGAKQILYLQSKTLCKCGLALRANTAITSQQQGHNRLENLYLLKLTLQVWSEKIIQRTLRAYDNQIK